MSEKKAKGGKREETVCLFRTKHCLEEQSFGGPEQDRNAMMMYYGRLLCLLEL
jgi:hypothetical protein